MQINSIKFRNFASYGNMWQTIDFIEDGAFVQVHGPNGSGKSGMSDAIKFAIYGKLENKKLKDIANRLNKHLEVRIHLTTKKGDIVIERGIEPGYFRLFFNGKMVDKAGKKSVQDYLEDELLEMPFYVFSNTLSLSINDFKSFIRMNNFDKRAIIDKIFGLQIVNQMREILKQQWRKLKENVDALSSQAKAYTKSLENSQHELDDLLEKIKSTRGERRIFLKDKEAKFEDYLKRTKSDRDAIRKKLEEIDLLRRDTETSISGDKQMVAEAKKMIKLYSNSKCPVCYSDLQTDFHQENLKQHQTTEHEATERLKEKEESLIKFNELIQINKTNLQKLQKQISTAELQYTLITRELDSMNDVNKKNEASQSLHRLVEKTKGIIKKSYNDKSEAEKKMSYFGLVEEILGERGVKQLAIKSILPSLNFEIQKLVKMLGIEHRIIFSEDFSFYYGILYYILRDLFGKIRF